MSYSLEQRMIQSIFTEEMAQHIVNYRLGPDLLARLDELRDKANEGQLTDDERAEYEQFVESLDLIGLLKAKARAVLEGRGS